MVSQMNPECIAKAGLTSQHVLRILGLCLPSDGTAGGQPHLLCYVGSGESQLLPSLAT